MSIKLSLISAVLIFASACVTAQEYRYISDSFRVPVRQSSCSKCKIIHKGLASGTRVEFLGESSEGWDKIKYGQSTIGWMPSRYLLDTPTSAERLVSIEANLTKTEQNYQNLGQAFEQLQTVLNDANIDLDLTKSTSEEGIISYEIPRLRGDYASMNMQNEALAKRNQELQQELDILTAEKERLSHSERNTSMLYGAGAVIAGVLITLIVGGMRRKKNYSEWG